MERKLFTKKRGFTKNCADTMAGLKRGRHRHQAGCDPKVRSLHEPQCARTSVATLVPDKQALHLSTTRGVADAFRCDLICKFEAILRRLALHTSAVRRGPRVSQ